MRAVIYARYSSDNQREESIEGQIRECTEYAMKNGIEIIDSYIDRALSARTDDRPDFQRMISDSEKRLFDTVLVWKLDRFSRNRYDSAVYKQILKNNNVRVISINENISEGPEGIILEAILEGYAEYYSADLSQKVARGQHENAIKGLSNGGVPPVGFYINPETHRLAIDVKMAPIVMEIFTRFGQGERIKDIIQSLTERGIKNRNGNDFKASNVGALLKNRKYIGEYKYGDVVIPNGIPKIIDEDLFERVQIRMKANQKAPAKAKAHEDYLLTTKLFCGDCGRLMVGESGKGHQGNIYRYYKCAGTKKRLGCKRKAIKKDWIEQTVVRLTVSMVLQSDVIERIAEAVFQMQDTADPMTPVIGQQLNTCEKEIENVLYAIRKGIITESTKIMLEELEAQRESLRIDLAQLQLKHHKFSKEEIVEWISRFKDGDINDHSFQKEIIDIFVNSVYVYDDKLLLTYNYKNGTQTLTLDEIHAVLGSDIEHGTPPKQRRHPSGCLSVCRETQLRIKLQLGFSTD